MLKISLMTAVALSAAAAPAAGPVYRLAPSIPLPDGGWDYASVDAGGHRLLVARTGSVTVVELAPPPRQKSIGSVERGHAAIPLPDGKRVLVTSGNDASVRFLDLASGAELARVAVGKKPDAAILDPKTGNAIVMNAEDGSVSILDTQKPRVLKTIAVKPGLEFAALAPDGTLFINDEDANEIEVVDPARGAVGPPIALPGCEAPSGLGYDAKRGLLISACANGKAAIVDAARRRIAALIDIGQGPDAVIMDPARRRAYIPCGKDGVLDVLSLDAPVVHMHMTKVQTETGARTGAVDPVSGTIYLPTARFGAPERPGARPAILPGTAHLVVVKPS